MAKKKATDKNLKVNAARTKDDLIYGACMLYLLYDNKQRAWRETAGYMSEAEKSSAAQPFFGSDNAQRKLAQAKIEFDELLDKHLAEYAKKKGLFFPSEEAIANANIRMEVIQKNIENGVRSKDDILLELNEWLDTITDPGLKEKYYKMYIDVTNMKKSDDMSDVQPCVVVLPEKNNINLFGYELHISPDKKQRFMEELRKEGVL